MNALETSSIIIVTILILAVFISPLSILKILESTEGADIGFVPSKGLFVNTPIKPLYDLSPYLLPLFWGGLFGTLVWRGKIKRKWSNMGFDHDEFKLVARMRGSPTRIKLLESLNLPKNRRELAKELGMDWKAIDSHVNKLLSSHFIEEMASVGTAKYYIISERGKRILKLLHQDGKDKGDNEEGITSS